MLALNEEVIAKTEVYFQAKKKSYYKNGITILEGRNSQCITLERNYVRKKNNNNINIDNPNDFYP